MTTSGTTSFEPEIRELIEEAYEQAGIELRSGYDFRTAMRSINLMLLEWQNKGLNFWSVEGGTLSLSAGTATYNLPTDTVDILSQVLRTGTGTSQVDYNCQRVSFAEYSNLSNKNLAGRPTQVWVARTLAPQVTFWPVPDATVSYTFAYYRMRRLEDAGGATATADLPTRFLPAFCAGLAFHLAKKRPELTPRVQALKDHYEELYTIAAGEDRDRSTLRIVPRAYR